MTWVRARWRYLLCVPLLWLAVVFGLQPFTASPEMAATAIALLGLAAMLATRRI